MRLRFFALFLLLATPVVAQEVVTTAQVTDWPRSAHDGPVPDRHWRGLDVLPFVERLTLTFAVSDGGSAPDIAARLTWRMGSEGIKRGRRVPAGEMPPGVQLVAFVVRADVVQQGERVGGLTLAVDSTRLSPGEVLLVEPEARWETLFDGVAAAEAKRIVAEGFTLENLRLVRAAFGVFDARSSEAGGRGRVIDRGVYDAYPDVWVEVAWDLGWLLGRDSRSRFVNGGRPRGATGRAAARPRRGRGGEEANDDDAQEDEEDESGEFLPAALGIGAAVVAGAVLSGSGGFAFNAREPIGLMSGFVRPRGGIVVQVSANAQALGLDSGDESITGQVLGFWGRKGQRVQPAVGLGARYHEQAGTSVLRAAITAGGVFRLGRVSVLTGYEFVGQRPAFGVLYTWR